MKTLVSLLLWALLLVLCWPLALFVLIAWPVVWVIAIPFRLAAVVVEAVLALLKVVLFLPARVLGGRTSRA